MKLLNVKGLGLCFHELGTVQAQGAQVGVLIFSGYLVNREAGTSAAQWESKRKRQLEGVSQLISVMATQISSSHFL